MERRSGTEEPSAYRGYPYHTWLGMVRRCHETHHKDFHHYGGRDIQVWGPWRGDFHRFVDDLYEEIGPRPEGRSLDRVDNDEGYVPGNLRWATQKQQHRNKRSNRLIDIDGHTRTLSGWCEHYGIGIEVVQHRLSAGWCTKRAFTQPVKEQKGFKRGAIILGKTIPQWAEETGQKKATLYARRARGWSEHEIVFGQ